MWQRGSMKVLLTLIAGLFFFPLLLSSQENILERPLSLPGNSIRTSRALGEISRLTGYLFTYDTKIINPNRRFFLSGDKMPVKEILDSVVNDKSVSYSVLGRHIILYRDMSIAAGAESSLTSLTAPFTLTGRVIDAESLEPLPYATIGILHHGKGTVTNVNGDFILTAGSEYLNDTLTVSYVGYVNRRLLLRSLPGNNMAIALNRDYIPIPEIIIRVQDPLQILGRTIPAIASNYGTTPAMMTGFYREGVFRKKELQIYSEAVVRLYKSAYARSLLNDQIKIIRSRKIENLEAKDTLAVRLKAGLSATLSLDGIKNLFDFIDPNSFNNYQYRLTDIVTIDGQTAFVISFRQKEWITEPLMQGDIYINSENYSLLLSEFEINPKYVDLFTRSLISRVPGGFSMKPEYVRYRTHYRNIDGRYYLSHVRGDLGFIARSRKRLFNSRFTLFFELAITEYTRESVARFSHEEVAPLHAIFSSTITGYDATFWKGFDFLRPEEDLVSALENLKVRLGEFSE